MKLIKVYLCLTIVAAVSFASAFSVSAIGFDAEEIYGSVFVVYSGNSLGSGFAVGKNCVVTNAHVISDPRTIYIRSYDGQEHRATIVGMDADKDIAVLAVAEADFAYLPLVDVAEANIGDDIYAIGAPKSMAYTLTKGVVSAKERIIGGNTYIQIDAAINEGNSGGPLMDDAGRVLGMNTLKMTDSEGIGLAIPSNVIYSYLVSLGIEVDGSGNIREDIPVPTETDDWQTRPTDGRSEERKDRQQKLPTITYVAFAVAGASLAVNAVLLAMLSGRKKNIPPDDPRDRTDFDIEILE